MKIKITENTFDEARNFLAAGTTLDLPTGLCHSLVNASKAVAVDAEGREALRKLIDAKASQCFRSGAR